MKLAARMILATFLLAVTAPALACVAIPPSMTVHHRDLVAESSQIVLARALAPPDDGTATPTRFETIEVLKGEVAAEFVLEDRGGLETAIWDRYPFGIPDSDFNGHRDIAVWDRLATRKQYAASCGLSPHFVQDETYLIFVDRPHWRAYELIRDADDLWLQAVRNLIADPSRRSGLSVTLPQWFSLAPRAFVARATSCNKVELELVEELLGEGEGRWSPTELFAGKRLYGPGRNCRVGSLFLVLVYAEYAEEPEADVSLTDFQKYMQSLGPEPDRADLAVFDVEAGAVDFTKVIDGDESELEIVGPRVWSLSDLQKQLSELVER